MDVWYFADGWWVTTQQTLLERFRFSQLCSRSVLQHFLHSFPVSPENFPHLSLDLETSENPNPSEIFEIPPSRASTKQLHSSVTRVTTFSPTPDQQDETMFKAFKIAVLGSGGVGKSALTIRLVTDTFLDEYDPTIEDSYRKQIDIDGQATVLDILDTAGQQEFSSMQDQWIRHGEGFLLVYSITCRSTFEEISNFHRKILRTKESEMETGDDDETIFPPPIVIVGNKCDESQSREVEYTEGEALATELGCKFFEASAKICHNNETVFFELVREIREKRLPLGKRKSPFFGNSKFCTIL